MVTRTLGRPIDRLAAPFAWPLDLDALRWALRPGWARGHGVVEEIVPRTSTAASIRIRPGRDWQGHRPGQHVVVGVDVDGVRHHRSYSPTSAPGDRDLEITVQAVPGGTVSQHLVHRARPGDVVVLGAVGGDVPPDDGRPLLLVTGGSGITPALGTVRALAAGAATPRDVVLLHHAPTADRVICGDELSDLEARSPWLHVEVSLTRQGGPHLDAARLDDVCPDWRERHALACGPPGLVAAAIDLWAAAGVGDRLIAEPFAPLRAAAAGDEGPATVTFAGAAQAATAAPGATLLAVAEEAGLLPPSGCRIGICHTCSTPLLDGCARDLRDGRLVEAGDHVQLCVSTAAGDLTLDLPEAHR
jgi:ferredoxin-NADP reductase